jgi:hypothetical protein
MINDQELKVAIREYTEYVCDKKINELSKIKIGSFIKYSDLDTSTRKADIQLYNSDKTPDSQALVPYILRDVPLFYIGNNNSQTDFPLLPGDEMLVLFIDDSTDEWRVLSGNVPKKAKRDDKHSIDFAVAIPVVTFHNVLTKSLPLHYQIKLQPSQKLQIGIETGGAYTIELIKEIHDVFKGMNELTTTDGDSFAAAFAAFKISHLTPLLAKLAILGVTV